MKKKDEKYAPLSTPGFAGATSIPEITTALILFPPVLCGIFSKICLNLNMINMLQVSYHFSLAVGSRWGPGLLVSARNKIKINIPAISNGFQSVCDLLL